MTREEAIASILARTPPEKRAEVLAKIEAMTGTKVATEPEATPEPEAKPLRFSEAAGGSGPSTIEPLKFSPAAGGGGGVGGGVDPDAYARAMEKVRSDRMRAPVSTLLGGQLGKDMESASRPNRPPPPPPKMMTSQTIGVATPFGKEGPALAGDVRTPTMVGPTRNKDGEWVWGNDNKGPSVAKYEEWIQGDMARLALDRGIDIATIDKATTDALREEAKVNLDRKIKSIAGSDESAQNTLVALETPEEQIARIKRGDTYVGKLIGAQAMMSILGSDNAYGRFIAPVLMNFERGVTQEEFVLPEGKKAKSSPVQEGRVWQFLRASSPISNVTFPYLFNSEMEWGDWGSDKHLAAIQRGESGFEWFRGGVAGLPEPVRLAATAALMPGAATAAAVMPGDQSEYVNTATAMVPILALGVIEPDMIGLGLGAGFGAARAALGSLEARMLEDVYGHALEGMAKARAEGKSIDQIMDALPSHGPVRDMAEFIRTSLLDEVSARAGAAVAAQVVQLRNLNDATDVARTSLQKVEQELAAAEALAQGAVQKHVADVNAAQKAAQQDVAAAQAAHQAAVSGVAPFRKAVTVQRETVLRFNQVLGELGKAKQAAKKATEMADDGRGALKQAAYIERFGGVKVGDPVVVRRPNQAVKHGQVVGREGEFIKVQLDGSDTIDVNRLFVRRKGRLTASKKDIDTVVNRSFELKKRLDDLVKKSAPLKAAASRTGNVSPELKNILDEMAAIKKEMVSNIGDHNFLMTWAYAEQMKDAAKAAAKDVGALEAWAAKLASADPKGRLARLMASYQKKAAQAGQAAQALGEARAAVPRKISDASDAAWAGVEGAINDVKAAKAAVEKQKNVLGTLEDVGGMFDRRVADLDKQMRAWAREVRKGTAEASAWKYSDSSLKDALIGHGGGQFEVDVSKWANGVVGKYGRDAVLAELRKPGYEGTASLLNLGHGPMKLSPEQFKLMRELEKGLHATAEAERVGKWAEAGGVARRTVEMGETAIGAITSRPIAALAKTPRAIFDALGSEGDVMGQVARLWTTEAYKGVKRMEKVLDPIAARGLGSAPKAVRDVMRRTYERITSTEHEANAIAEMSGIKGVWDYLMSTTPVALADDAVTTMNTDGVPLFEKAIGYLRAIKKGDPELYAADPVRLALARAFLASGVDKPSDIAMAALDRLVDDASLTGWALKTRLEDDIAAATGASFGTTDVDRRAQLFLIRAVSNGAALYDGLVDTIRYSGPLLDKSVVDAFDLFSGQVGRVEDLGNLVTGQREAAAKGASMFGMPFATKANVRYDSPAYIPWAKATVADMRFRHVAQMEGQDIYLPQHIMDALKDMPRRLAKELEPFQRDGNWITNVVDRYLGMWSFSMLWGFGFPRLKRFVDTAPSDFTQMAVTAGIVPAVRLTAQNSVAYIPFIGRALQTKLSEKAMRSASLSGIFDPTLGRVVHGDTKLIIETSDGPMTARQFLREAIEDGTNDSISTKELHELTMRSMESTGDVFMKYMTGRTKLIESAAKMMEAIQYRQRLAFYVEARTGRMTGTPLPRNMARDVMLEALFDWKQGAPPWMGESIVKWFAFGKYKMNALRHTQRILLEGLTTPGHDFIAKAMVGQTKLGRTRAVVNAGLTLSEAATWHDPTMTQDDAQQLEQWIATKQPWFIDSQWLLGQQVIDRDRQDWWEKRTGKRYTAESLIGPSLSVMEYVYGTMFWANMGAATSVWLAEKAGLQPNITTIPIKEANKKAIDHLTDGMYEPWKIVVKNIMYPMAGVGRDETPDMAFSRDQVIMLTSLGWDKFFLTPPDEQGRRVMHGGAVKVLGTALAVAPPALALAREWAIFDNPSMGISFGAGIREALLRLMGLYQMVPHDPLRSYEAELNRKSHLFTDLSREADVQTSRARQSMSGDKK